ncbi:FG-GAP-like repeat-containing protein [Bacteroidota bacterium]
MLQLFATYLKKFRLKISSVILLLIIFFSHLLNIHAQIFTEQTDILLTGAFSGSVVWGDYDNDNDLDILLTGSSNYLNTIVYLNNSDNTFTEQTSISLIDVSSSSVAWGDYDLDGDLDILLTGDSQYGRISTIYKNNLPDSSGFSEQTDISLTGNSQGSVAWGDYDNDGDLDILMCGEDVNYNAISKIYRNDGENTFIEQTGISLEGVQYSSAAWGDYDNDGDLDILLTGYNLSNNVSKIYKNNANNTFSEQTGISLEAIRYGSIAWGDYNNDGNLDILLTGSNGSTNISKVYKNNGDSTFTVQTSISLTGVSNSSIAWGDYDNDGDLDILLTGNANSVKISKIYKNNLPDSSGFSELTDISLTGINQGSVAWGDYDNDGDLDILLAGSDANNLRITKIYKNSTITPNTNPNKPSNIQTSVTGNSVTFKWNMASDNETTDSSLSYNLYIDSISKGFGVYAPMANTIDGYRRIVERGKIQDTTWIIYDLDTGKYYWSVQSIDNSFAGSEFATEDSFIISLNNNILPSDDQGILPDEDGTPLVVTETETVDSRQWKYSPYPGGPYNNELTGETGITYIPNFPDLGCYYIVCICTKGGITVISNEVKIEVSSFSEQTKIIFPKVQNSSVTWGDYDNDGDLDFLLTGNNGLTQISEIYKNNGDNSFNVQSDIFLTGVEHGSCKWGDYDNDGDLDILLTGSGISKIYRNNGNNIFSEQTNISLTGVQNSSAAWGDYDNDGDLDIVLTGKYGSTRISKIYKNNKNNFIEQSGISLTGVQNSSVTWGDYNKDGYLDILLTGYTGTTQISKIYKNNCNNTFTEQTDISLTGVEFGSSVWGDYDNDGDLDILLTGYTGSNRISKIYKNNLPDSLGFSEQTDISLPGVQNSSVAWGDYDNDGNLDIILTGYNGSDRISKIYKKNVDNSFSEQTDISLIGVESGSSIWGDYDNDGDLDILLTGYTGLERISKIYKNNIAIQNTAPNAPIIIQTEVRGNSVTFKWTKALDNETPQNALTYNMRIDTISDGFSINSPMADISSGFRKIVKPGKIQDTIWTINNLDTGTYYWSVQAIDNNYAGSSFATEGNFNVLFKNNIIPEGEQVIIPGEDGTELTVVETETADSRQWKYSIYPGGPYNNIILGSTGTNYIPNFSNKGYYYLVCTSFKGIDSVISNEIKMEVSYFSEQTAISLTGVQNSSAAWGDYDNDGDLDILLTGSDISKIYRNNGDNSFLEQTNISLPGIQNGSVAWGDYNNDDYIDILLTGSTLSKIFKNNGDNSFTEQTNISITDVVFSSVAWGDYNNDGGLDILLTGGYGFGIITQLYTKIYSNNVNNTFTEQTDINLPDINYSSVAWADYNKDDYLDILLSGYDFNGNYISKIYKNNGNGGFEDINANLTGVMYSSVAWGDYDNDGDLDILICGLSNHNTMISEIYINSGLGNYEFIKDTIANLTGVQNSSAAWGDYDNDGDLDVLLTGYNSDWVRVSKIYKNNRPINEEFIEQTEINLTGVTSGSVAWGDYDNDGDLDILLTGSFLNSKIYRNNTLIPNSPPSPPNILKSKVIAGTVSISWHKAEDIETPKDGLSYNIVVSKYKDSLEIISPMSDLINGYRKIPAMGFIKDTSYTIKNLDIGKYFWRVQSIDAGFSSSVFSMIDSFIIEPIFTDTEESLYEVAYGSGIWGDYDNDGDLDILLFGAYGYQNNISKIFKNNGDNSFTEQTSISIIGVNNGSAAWGDYDNDGDLDILITGYTGSANISKIYSNNGDSTFSENTNISLPGISNSSVAWGDYDNDGDLDILLSGNNDSIKISKIYTNNGTNLPIFTEQTDIFLTGVEQGSAVWGDYDNDGNIDILLTGLDNNGNPTSKIYRNINNRFYEQIDISLVGVRNSSATMCDYDNDGDLDILIAGSDAGGDRISKFYKNNYPLTPSFIEKSDIINRGIKNGSIAWGDYDNDGDLDLLLSGESRYEISLIYQNEGNDIFTELDYGIIGVVDNSVAWGDFDNDKDLDILITGSGLFAYHSKIYQNNGNWENNKATAPANLQSVRVGYGVLLSWNATSDDLTPSSTLTYNLRVGITPGGNEIVTSMSNPVNGDLSHSITGNCSFQTQRLIDSLPEGKYYWCVQAIDQTYLGGGWAVEDSFTITVLRAYFDTDTVCFGDSTHFGDSSLTAGESIIAWSWDFGDGNTSTEQHPVHLYDESGTYDVKLVVYSATYQDSITQKVIVKHKPVVDFTANIVCDETLTTFTNTSFTDSVSGVTWNWDFGDGIGSSTNEDPGSYRYFNPGSFSAELIAVADNGCSDSISKTVTVVAYPDPSLSLSQGNLTFCVGGTLVLSSDEGLNYTYQWRRDGVNIYGEDVDSIIVTTTGDYQSLDDYSVEITDTIGNCITISDTLSVDILNVPTPPTISTGSATTFCQGDSVELYVANNPDYSYRWLFNSGQVGDSNILVVKPGLNGTYNYSLEVENSGGCIATSANTINVIVNSLPVKPSIIPSGSNEFCDGKSISLIVPKNPDYTYQWKDGILPISGANDTGYKATTSGDYILEITDTNACIVNTDAFNVEVFASPIVPTITSLSTTNFCQGDSVILSIPNNTDYKYQWKLGDGGTVGTGNSFTVKPLISGIFNYTLDVELDSTNCIVSSTDTIDVLVYANPTIPTIIPSTLDSVCDGESVTLTVPENLAYTYQWKEGLSNITGDTNTIYEATTSGSYSLQIENSDGCIVTTNAETVTVLPSPTSPTIITSGPTTFCKGDSVVLSVTNNLDYTYNWRLKGGSVGATNVFKVKPNVSDTFMYNLQIVNSNGCDVISANSIEVIALPVADELEINSNDDDNEICLGESVQLNVPNNTNYNYLWKRDGADVGEDTNRLITQPSVSGTYQYSLDVEHAASGCITPASNVIDLTVHENPNLPTITTSGATSFCSGNSVSLSVINNTDYTYQWYKGPSIISQAITNSYTATDSGNYNLKITNAYGCEVNTYAIQVNVYPTPDIPTIVRDGDTTFCEGESVKLIVNNDTSNIYQWKNGDIVISVANSNTYTASITGRYLIEISNSSGCYVLTDTMNITVLPSPDLPVITYTGDTTFCEGDSLLLSTSNDPDYTYQWYKGNGKIDMATVNSYTVYTPGKYSIAVMNEHGCYNYSLDSVIVNVNPLPTLQSISSTGDKIEYCSDDEIILSMSQEEGNTYQWRLDGRNITGENGSTISDIETGSYSFLITNTNNCFVETPAMNINVYERPITPEIDLSATSLQICPQEEVTIQLKHTYSNYEYQWKLNGNPIPDENLSSLQGELDKGVYLVSAKVGVCESTSQEITVEHKDAPEVPEIEAFGPVWWYLACSNDTANEYKWFYNDVLIEGAIERDYVAGQDLGSYYVVIKEGGDCYIASEVITIPPGAATGIELESVFGIIKIYPNPTPGLFTIEMENNLYGELMIDINNEAGVMVLMMEILKNHRHFKTNVDLSGQGKGLYFIGFKFEKEYTVRKLVVE